MDRVNSIEIENLSKVYRSDFLMKRYKALNELTLNVPEGSVFGFLGANGAGKTTTIKILMNLQYASSGNVRIFGEKHGLSKVRERVGYMPEQPVFHLDLTGNEFLNFHRSLYGKTAKKKRSNKELLELVQLSSNVSSVLLREFSKGMLQRIGIAQSLVNDPDLIILDEPMSGLDPLGRKDIRNLIGEFSSKGKTIFFSTHILSDVETICSQIAFLKKGVLTATGTLEDILVDKEDQKQELIFTNIEKSVVHSSPLLKEAISAGSNTWKLILEEEKKTREGIEHVWEKGGSVLSLNKHHRSLEEILFKE